MHQIFGATLRNLPGTWVGSYYGRIRQQRTLTKKLVSQGTIVCTQLLLYNCMNKFESRAYVPLHVATVVGVGVYHTLIRSYLYENRSDYTKMIWFVRRNQPIPHNHSVDEHYANWAKRKFITVGGPILLFILAC